MLFNMHCANITLFATKLLFIFSYFSMKTYVVGTQWKHLKYPQHMFSCRNKSFFLLHVPWYLFTCSVRPVLKSSHQYFSYFSMKTYVVDTQDASSEDPQHMLS